MIRSVGLDGPSRPPGLAESGLTGTRGTVRAVQAHGKTSEGEIVIAARPPNPGRWSASGGAAAWLAVAGLRCRLSISVLGDARHLLRHHDDRHLACGKARRRLLALISPAKSRGRLLRRAPRRRPALAEVWTHYRISRAPQSVLTMLGRYLAFGLGPLYDPDRSAPWALALGVLVAALAAVAVVSVRCGWWTSRPLRVGTFGLRS